MHFFPGGGEKKIASEKLDWKANSKVGSTDNMKHKAGGGNVKVGVKKSVVPIAKQKQPLGRSVKKGTVICRSLSSPSLGKEVAALATLLSLQMEQKPMTGVVEYHRGFS